MIFVTADLHGFPLSRFRTLLDKAGFNRRPDDFLFVLGDVIDRNGDGGVETLLWLTEQPNAQLLLGNHEAMLLSCRWIFDTVTDASLEALEGEQLSLMSNWMYNGGRPTIRALQELAHRDPDAIGDILDYLEDCPLYDTVSAGGQDFLLTHSGLGNFRRDKRLSEYTPDELLWNRPALTDRYFDRVFTVFGHTPAGSFPGHDPNRAVRTDSWMDIDVGAGHGGSPMVLRLDDMAEFYL